MSIEDRLAERVVLKSNILLMDLMTDGESLKLPPDEAACAV